MDIKTELVVLENFCTYVKGEIIKDAAKVKEILASEWEAHVIKRAAPAPAAKAK